MCFDHRPSKAQQCVRPIGGAANPMRPRIGPDMTLRQRFLGEQEMTQEDAVNFILYGIVR